MFDAGQAQSLQPFSDNMVERGRMGDAERSGCKAYNIKISLGNATHRFITINGYKLFKCKPAGKNWLGSIYLVAAGKMKTRRCYVGGINGCCMSQFGSHLAS